MAASETVIANQALGAIGSSLQIASMTEQSNEARACLLYYADCRDMVLSEFPWPFAKRVATLSLVANDPNASWPYSYRYPSDALTIRIVPSDYDRYVVTDCVPINFEVTSDATGKLIYTDQQNASVEYTVRVTDVTLFPADLSLAIAYKLGSMIGPMLSAQAQLADRCVQLYEQTIDRARTRAANEDGRNPSPDSEYITARF